MKNTYFDLIKKSFDFPQEGFSLDGGNLSFYGVAIKPLIEKYGTPFKLVYLPRIGQQIEKARNLFQNTMVKHGYRGDYHYCYCTKCNHYSHVIDTALKHKVHLETSSAFDIDIIKNLYKKGKIDNRRFIIHNGFKTDDYLLKIIELRKLGFENSIVVLDSVNELKRIEKISGGMKIKIGLRMAIDEQAQSAYHTSRLGIRPAKMLSFFDENIRGNENFELVMFHFFVDSGIKDTLYYRGEFTKALNLYIELKRRCNTLNSFNIGGGFPIKNHLGFSYDFEGIIDDIVSTIKESCDREKVMEPDIFTEFGKYTVGESSAIIFQVLETKKQNDSEIWYIIDNSLLNTIPDAWSLHERFILLPVNKWDAGYQRVNIGGISCDSSDYYNSEDLNQEVKLPKIDEGDNEPLYLGFFHTGAYQDSVSGYGGVKHCLIPMPLQIIIDKDAQGKFTEYVYGQKQSAEEIFKVLGY